MSNENEEFDPEAFVVSDWNYPKAAEENLSLNICN